MAIRLGMPQLVDSFDTSKAEAQRLAAEQKKARHAWLKDAVLAEKLQFTYIRNYVASTDVDAEGDEVEVTRPATHGGVVVCWQMPKKPTDRMLEVAIAWCHENERFDKIEGRYTAAKNFLEGKRVLFKLDPGAESISAKLVFIFENGFSL